MGSGKSISVEVVHAGEGQLFRERVCLRGGATLSDAIRESAFAGRFPDVPVSDGNVGVFSRKVGLGYVLADGDRVEIYRPLKLTPNEVRKLRAARRGRRDAR